MSAKIIDSHRYKTITKTQVDKKRKNVENSFKSNKKSYKKSNKYSTNDSNNSFISNLRIKKLRERKLEREMLLYSRPQRTVIKEPKQKVYIPKSFGIICAILVLIVLVYISAKIMKLDEVITANVFNNSQKEQENINLEKNYNLSIGLTALNNTNVNTSTNLILNDIYKATSLSLIKVEQDYSLKYQVARNIAKNSNKEYVITLNEDYNLDVDDIVFSIDSIMSFGESNMYYDRLSIIENVDKLSKYELKLTLKDDNPYFIYYLDFPLLDNENKITGEYIYNSDESGVTFTRANLRQDTTLESIRINNYNTVDEVVDEFVNGNIDLFFATSNNDMQLIGKKDYNVKKYKDGETLFLFGNKNSNVFSRKEIRTALMYSLNRDEIVKNSDNNFIEVIDLPFLYSTIKYKYDVVGAQNIMNSNGWNKNGYGIYEKYENGNYIGATLRLLVNEQDTNKVNIANNIKNMAQNVGINIEIETLSQENISQRVQSGNYDIVLASVYLNETPNISFLKNYLNINEETDQAFLQVENSNAEDLPQNIQNLEYVLSNEVACIGIYARNINLVYQKYISGFDNINYMKIFYNINNIGKIIE
mgnify:FL=1